MNIVMIILEWIVLEWLYQRYGMCRKGWSVRLLCASVLMGSIFYVSSLSLTEQYNSAALIGGLFYIALVDFKRQRIPNTLLVFLTINRIVVLSYQQDDIEVSVLACLVWLIGLGLLHKLLKNGFGAGDVKLMSVIGLYIGLWHSAIVLLVSCGLICIIGTFRFLVKRDGLNVYLPMAPFVCVAFIVVFCHSLYFLGGFTL